MEHRMQSTSTLSIAWTKPTLEAEQWEFSHHPAKQEFYRRHSLDWEKLQAVFDDGRLVPYPRADRIMGIPVSLSYASYDDYAKYLARAKRGYRRSYT
jgi:hypothetical protein